MCGIFGSYVLNAKILVISHLFGEYLSLSVIITDV